VVDSSHLRLDSLEETIIENNVKLVVVDSIASIARKVLGTDVLLCVPRVVIA
jgi:hypothetical protein